MTVSLASSPSPSRMRTVPSPYLLWRTRWPFFSSTAPVGAGTSILGRERAPGFNAPALPPKKRAMLSMEWPSAGSLFWTDSELEEAAVVARVEVVALAVIHDAVKGFDGEDLPLKPFTASWMTAKATTSTRATTAASCSSE